MKMQKRKFRIGELARLLNVERFVIRFWEKEFFLRATRSEGGQRFYDEKDLERFSHIKDLLYDKGFTIAGARKQLKSKLGVASSGSGKTIIASQKVEFEPEDLEEIPQEQDRARIEARILQLQKQLLKLRELL
jgi:DNA-binding transcriptional MerR regulator